MTLYITIFDFRIGHEKTKDLALNDIKHSRNFNVNRILIAFFHFDVSVRELSTFSGDVVDILMPRFRPFFDDT
jgi:hypothetical protein